MSRFRLATKSDIERVIMTQNELAAQLTAVTDQITKIGTETAATLQKVKDLEAVIAAGGEVSAEVQTALDALKAQAQLTDDLVPDAPSTGGASSPS
jgi:hypothetical protein